MTVVVECTSNQRVTEPLKMVTEVVDVRLDPGHTNVWGILFLLGGIYHRHWEKYVGST